MADRNRRTTLNQKCKRGVLVKTMIVNFSDVQRFDSLSAKEVMHLKEIEKSLGRTLTNEEIKQEKVKLNAIELG